MSTIFVFIQLFGIKLSMIPMIKYESRERLEFGSDGLVARVVVVKSLEASQGNLNQLSHLNNTKLVVD